MPSTIVNTILGFQHHRHQITLVAVTATHTVVLLSLTAAFALTSQDAFAWAVIVGWALLSAIVTGIRLVKRPPVDIADLERLRVTTGRPGIWLLGAVPLVQASLMFFIIWLLAMSGTGVDITYLVTGDGVGGILLTFGLTLLVAYIAELIGFLVTFLIGFPALIVTGGIIAVAKKRRAGLPMLYIAMLVLCLAPFAVGIQLGVTGPDTGRPAILVRFLVLIGFDVDGYAIDSHGWLWTARIIGAVMVLLLATLFLAGALTRRPDHRDVRATVAIDVDRSHHQQPVAGRRPGPHNRCK